MFIYLTAAGLILLYMISAYGWGEIAARRLYRYPTHSISFKVSLGMSLWV